MVRRVFGVFSASTALVVVLSLISAAATVGLAVLLGRAVDLVGTGHGLDASWFTMTGVELLLCAGSALLIPVVISRSSRDLTTTSREQLIRHYLAVGPLAVRKLGQGELLDAVMDAVDRKVRYRTGFIGPAISAVATPVLVLASIAVLIDPVSALLLVIPTALVPFIVLGFQKRFRGSSGEYRKAQGILSATFLDALRSLGMLKLNGGGSWMGAKIAAASERVRLQVMKLLARNQLVLLVIDASFAVLLIASAALLAWWRTSSSAISGGAGLSLILLSFLMLAPVNYVGSFFYIGMTGRSAEEKIDLLLQTRVHRSSAGPVNVSLETDGLELQGLSAGYATGVRTLENLNFSFPPGSRTAILGASGSGKTTLLRVLQGQLETSEGLIHDGRQGLGPATLRAHTAVVEQSTTLFGISLRENLKLGAMQTTDQMLLTMLDKVGLGQWFAAQPNGLDQVLGEGGATMSGGQSQRLALARALLSKRPVLLLDEPTSALDVDSEAEVLKTLKELGQGLITITVTHRLGLLADYDRVMVLEDGKIIQAGSRQQLMAEDGYLKSAIADFAQRSQNLEQISSAGEAL